MEDDRRRHGSGAASSLRPCSGRVSPAADVLVGRARTLPNMGPQTLAAAGLVLLLLYLTGRYLWLYNKDAAQAAQAAAAAASSSSSSRRRPLAGAASSLPRHAVPLSSSSLLPVFFVLHVAVPVGPGAESAECAVCLAEFREREAGRLLPRCGHAFHEECIAMWLRVSTTCPLCRAPVATK